MECLYLLDADAFQRTYPEETRARIARLVGAHPPHYAFADVPDSVLSTAEVLLGGDGTGRLDSAFLARAPALTAVLYGFGSVRHIVTPEMWERDIRVSSARAANAIPVAEYVTSVIHLSLKQVWRLSQDVRDGLWPDVSELPGSYGHHVGLVGLGSVGQQVATKLARTDLVVTVYDPTVSHDGAQEGGASGRVTTDLDELFSSCDVVSIHLPLLDSTRGLITGSHVAQMRTGATLINTARGAVLDEPEVLGALEQRRDIFAVVDVTDPEPPAPSSRWRSLPNVVVTPHVAGALGAEQRRLGEFVADDLQRLLIGERMAGEVDPGSARVLA